VEAISTASGRRYNTRGKGGRIMREFENAVPRPSTFKGYIGDPTLMARLQEHITAAKVKGTLPPHMLFSGQPGTGKTTIAMIVAKELNLPVFRFVGQELKKASQLKELFKIPASGAMLFIDECLPAGSMVVRSDGGVHPIEDIVSGELYAGGVIKNTLSRMADTLLRITTTQGEIVTTHTHPHMSYIPRYDKRLTGQGEVKEVRGQDLRVGDYLLSTTSIPHTVNNSWTPAQLAFVAMIISDGCVTTGKYKDSTYAGNSLQLSWSKRAQFIRAKQIIEAALPTFKVQPTSYTAAKNRDYVVRIYGAEFVKFICETFSIPTTNKKYTTVINNEIFYAPLESVKSFIDTILAFEGWSVKGHGKYVRMSSPAFIKQFQLLLKKFGIASGVYRFTPKGSTTEALRLHISDKRTQARSITFAGVAMRPAKITKIEVIPGRVKVYDFTTSTGYFTADGFFTHNCHSVSKEIAELLYPIMEDRQMSSPTDPTLMLYLNPLLVVGATTEPGSLEKPLLDRFSIKLTIPMYTDKQMVAIVAGMVSKIGRGWYSPDGIAAIARRSKNVPRIAGNLIYQVNDSAIANNVKVIDEKYVNEIMLRNGVTADGLDETDRKIIEALQQHNTLGLTTLATFVGEDPDWVSKVYEPYLMRMGYLTRGHAGRQLTDKGRAVKF
jgi:Holliday junction resolvasome RuvABC ATP-dependent DNA helicase subunit